jgi:hypothetical protein
VHNLGRSAVRWAAIQALFDPDAFRHRASVTAAGLYVPLDVFEQLFHDHHDDEGFEQLVRAVDWARVEWTEASMAGVSLRQVRVPRAYQHAVDEARAFVLEEGLQDDRPDVVENWHTAGTWLVPPVLVAGSAIGGRPGDELLVGFTRLGNLLGLLDRGEVPGNALHRVWLGRRLSA